MYSFKLKQQLLNYFNISEQEYDLLTKDVNLNSLPNIADNKDTLKALDIINKVKEKNGKVLIYGDYDCDGICSTSIIYLTLKKLGINASFFIPSRYLDGYGLTNENIVKIVDANYDLLILVDNGITCFEQILYAHNHNLLTIIIDHHTIDKNLPLADAIIHDEMLSFGSYNVSAGFLSFLFSQALLKECDEYLLTLAGLSILSDVMSLRDYNRDIVKLAIKYINQNHYAQFYLLSKNKYIDDNSLKMDIIPKINAVGRICEDHSAINIVKYLCSNQKLNEYANWIENINDKRKEITTLVLDNININHYEEAIVLNLETKEGMLGLIANRLLKEYKKPVAILATKSEDESLLIGSIRSEENINVMSFFAKAKIDFISKGGHANAGGFCIKKDDFEIFKKEFIYFVLKNKLEMKKENYICLKQNDLTLDNISLIMSFGPFGQNWPNPQFVLEDILTNNLTYTTNGKYLSTNISYKIRLFSFNLSSNFLPLNNYVNLYGEFSTNYFTNQLKYDFYVYSFKVKEDEIGI